MSQGDERNEALTDDELASVVGGDSDPDDPVPAARA